MERDRQRWIVRWVAGEMYKERDICIKREMQIQIYRERDSGRDGEIYSDRQGGDSGRDREGQIDMEGGRYRVGDSKRQRG